MKRQEIDEKYKWDLSDLCKSSKEFNSRIKKIPKLIDELAKYQGHLLDSSENLYNFLQEKDKVEEEIEHLDMYAHLMSTVNTNDHEAAEEHSQILNLIAEYNSRFSFVNNEIISHDFKMIEEMIDSYEPLSVYRKMFEDMFRLKSHLLSEVEESIICKYEPIIDRFKQASNLIRNKEMKYDNIIDEDGNEVSINASSVNKYAVSKDRNVRRQAFEVTEKACQNHIDSLATNLIGFVESTETEAKMRGYKSAIEEKFDTIDVDFRIYDILMKNLRNNKDSYKKYVELYKKVLNISDLCSYDLNAPLVSSDRDYTVEEAKDMILDTFKIYGDKYMKVLNFAFDKKCIDFLPSDEKITSWFSCYSPYDYPRVFANFRGKILDISSLSHELGHFCNQYLTIENQPSQYVYSSPFIGEVASLCNEFIFALANKDKGDLDTKKALINNFIKIFAGNFFGAGRQAVFEEKMHSAINSNIPLSSKKLNEFWNEANDEVMGNIIPHSSLTWSMIPHYFMDGGYYVMFYSTSTIAACNLAYKIVNQEDGILDKYYKFLSSGSSKKPLELLELLGIDLLDDNTYEIAIKMFDDMVEEYIGLEE